MCNFRHVPICKAGRLLGETKGDISTAYTYNNAGWLTSKSNTSNGQTTTYALTYFSDGNIASRAENGVTTNYTYDNLGQLVKENDTTYEYDTRGNRIKRTYGEVVTDYRYDRTNKLMTQNTGDLWTAYAYDENGNNTLRETYEQITENGTTSQNPVEYLAMTYDPLNRLTKAQSEGMTAEYTYGIDNMRTTKTVNGVTTKYAWDRGNIAYERDPGTLSTTYYHYGIGLVASRIINDATFYQTNDHGDVTAWGDVAYSYDAFGNEKTESTGENNFRYSGEYYDEETGFIYLRNRYYDPSTGRFINEDPIRDGYNWYVYCHNDPVNFKDSLGLVESRDKKILTQDDYEKVLILTEIYNWAKEQNDGVLADYAHYEAVKIRQNKKYTDSDYGPIRSVGKTTGGVQIRGTAGYADCYNYTYDVSKKRVELFISKPASAEDAGWESGTWVHWVAEAYPTETVKEQFFWDVGKIIAEQNPLFNTFGQGDRTATVTRYFESVRVVKYEKVFYFSVDKDDVEMVHVK